MNLLFTEKSTMWLIIVSDLTKVSASVAVPVKSSY